MPGFEIVSGVVPEALDRVTALHGSYYRELWGFGAYFEEKVGSELARFLERYEPDRDGLWTAFANGRVEGSIAIDGTRAATDGAHLRWFIVSDALRGRGAGGGLIGTAMRFCRDRAYPMVYLWTFEGLDAAKHLYEREGFACVEQRRGATWGVEVNEQRFECAL
ncbi:MAG: GNAT family N-acetyltransferase [Coriobacteriia bacterium]